MARSTVALARVSRLAFITATVRLARWRLRHTWRLLSGVGLGIVVAVIIVSAVPLFTHVATTAGLRRVFDAPPGSNGITINVTTENTQSQDIQQIGNVIDGAVQTHLGHTLMAGRQFSLQFPELPVVSALHGAVTEAAMQVVGYDPDQFVSHATVLAGRLPRADAAQTEIALTTATADALGATLGSTVVLAGPEARPPLSGVGHVPLTVVGIVALNGDDIFFHRLFFDPQPREHFSSSLIVRGIAVNDALERFLQSPSATGTLSARTPPQFFWYYALDPARLDADSLGDVVAQANALQVELPNTLLDLQGAPRGGVSDDAFLRLADYQARITTLQVPLTFVLVLIVALVLFFVSVMAEIVVDRQADALAVLRSRGVSRPQIFGALVAQSLVLGVVALAVGPWLALGAVVVLARLALAPAHQSALTVLTADPLRTAYAPLGVALAVVVAALGAMIIAINRAVAADVLAMRRESARTTRTPLWQRLNLDVVAAVIAVTGYSLYILVLNRVNAAVQFQFGFLGLIAPLFALFAGALLCFRVYPLGLRAAAWVAARGRGPVPMLALAQMSRAPRQSMRTTFLLAFSTAFLIFTLLFVASETQHLRDVASFSAGADFSGALAFANASPTTLAGGMAPYQQLPGVTSVALGYVATLPPGAGVATQQLLAVDADHYAQAATWDAHNSTEPLAGLMARLVSQRADAKRTGVIPAILNGALWDALHLTPGTTFLLSVPGYDGDRLRFLAVARVAQIQGIYDSPQFLSGGVLVDYQSYAAVFTTAAATAAAQPNFLWLRSASDAASLTSVRAALTTSTLKLARLTDRRSLTQALITDPLQVALSGILSVGALAAIVLALVGVLTASWLNARGRLTNFAVLRALGTAPRQIAGVLVWEQGITYGVALALGVGLGIVLAALLLPALAFANARTQSGDLIGAANLPAIEMLAPAGTLALALGALVAICGGALVLMTAVVARPSVSATLRLNED